MRLLIQELERALLATHHEKQVLTDQHTEVVLAGTRHRHFREKDVRETGVREHVSWLEVEVGRAGEAQHGPITLPARPQHVPSPSQHAPSMLPARF